jgi:hypothetical protein
LSSPELPQIWKSKAIGKKNSVDSNLLRTKEKELPAIDAILEAEEQSEMERSESVQASRLNLRF